MKYWHDKLRVNWAGHVASTGRGGAYRVLVGKPEGKRPIRRQGLRRDNTKIIISFYYFVQQPTNAQLIENLLYCSYMFQHYCVILRELIVSTLLSYTSIYLNINQLDALNFIMSLFQASTCFEHLCSSSGGQNCTIQPLVSSRL